MKRRTTALLLSVLMIVNVFAFTTAAVSNDIELSHLPKADIVNLIFNEDGTVTNDVTETPWKSASVDEYTSGTTKSASFTKIESADFQIGKDTYSEMAFCKTAATNSIGIDLSANKSNLTAALSDGFSAEASFVCPGNTSSSTSQTIFAAANTGGFGFYIKEGKFLFQFYSGGGNKNLNLAEIPVEGKFYHVIVTFADNMLSVYLNGHKDENTLSVPSGFGAGGYFGTIGVGGSTSAATNFSKFPLGLNAPIFSFKLYNTPLTDDECVREYTKYISSLSVKAHDATGEADAFGDAIVKLKFGKGYVYASEHSLGNPELTGNGSYNNNYKKVKVTVDGEEYTVPGYKRTTTSIVKMLDFANSLLTELANGFTLETSFVIPEGIVSNKYNYFIGAYAGGGFGISVDKTGNLCFAINDGAQKYVTAPCPKVGTYCHVVAIYNAEAKKISMWLNGEKVGETAVKGFTPGNWANRASIGLGASTESANNNFTFNTNPGPANTVITGLSLYSGAYSDDECRKAYVDDLARFGIKPVEKEEEYTDDFTPILRFMVTSDIHVNSDGDARCAKLSDAISDAYDIAATASNPYKELDAFEIVGDMADTGSKSQLEAVKAVLDSGLDYDKTQLLVTMGNHEFYEGSKTADDVSGKIPDFNSVFNAAKEKLADGVTLIASNGAANTHYKINGYHFINVSVDQNGWDYSNTQKEWLETQLKTAEADTGKDKPIFVFRHVGTVDTVLGTDSSSEGPGVEAFAEVLNDYPEVVDFSGHSHQPLNTPYSILQDGCTMLNTGTLKSMGGIYDENGSRLSPSDGTSIWDVSQVYIVEVDAESKTRIRIYDISKNEFVGETYILDSYNPDNFKYTADRLSDAKIEFADGAKITVNKVTKNTVTFKFNVVSPDSLPVSMFEAVVEDTSGNTVANRYLTWSYYKGDFDVEISTAIGGLAPNTDYVLKVYPFNTGYSRSAKDGERANVFLSEQFKTTDADTAGLTADILDISVKDGSVTDISGNMTASQKGAPVYEYNADIGMNTVKFAKDADYIKLSDYKKDAEGMAYGFTMEAYFRIDEINAISGNKAIICSEQTGGFGFDMKPDGTVTYSVYAHGGYKTVPMKPEIGKFYHWVCVYDGSTLTCYVNGKMIKSMAAEAPMTYNSLDAECIYLGADTTGTGGAERQGRTTIALARIYSEPASETQAIEMWDEVKKLQNKEVYPDDDDNPEYYTWTQIDDTNTDYVKIVDNSGKVHSHDNDAQIDVMNGGSVQRADGTHLFNETSHTVSGTLKATVSFTGVAFRYVLQYRGPAGQYASSVDVYVDGEYYGEASELNANNDTKRYVAFEILRMDDKKHEVTLVSHDGIRFVIDLFEVVIRDGKDDYKINNNVIEINSDNILKKNIPDDIDEITEIRITDNVKTIGSGAFADFINATEAYIVGNPQIAENAFPAETKIYGFTNTSAEKYCNNSANTFVSLENFNASKKQDGLDGKSFRAVFDMYYAEYMDAAGYEIIAELPSGAKKSLTYKVSTVYKGLYGMDDGNKVEYFAPENAYLSAITIKNITSDELADGGYITFTFRPYVENIYGSTKVYGNPAVLKYGENGIIED